MKAAEIRQRFLRFFEERGHKIVTSSPLVPGNDPTLLFTNAGMVQFKGVFLGQEAVPYSRAVTSQKCVRAGGKHNDLEQVGKTTRHHTFFEMLGNFSFGDYFKREAIRYGWDFLTQELGLDASRLYVTVHHTDDEAVSLWQEVAGVPEERIYRLGDKDNFWQMADTGPCGPCSEIHYDMRPNDELGVVLPTAEFEERGERGEFLELWNLVFMQFNRDEAGTQHPLPAPSIDTGAGLERLAAVLQGVDSNYHTDLFAPLLARAGDVLGREYSADGPEGVSYRVLADHARAVAFLLVDGVFPSNEGRGYVLRRILRRAVRHAWLLGRREPTLVDVVDEVVATMSDAYPTLGERAEFILETTRGEEIRFLNTIEGGLERFDSLAPVGAEGSATGPISAELGVVEVGVSPQKITGEDAFKLYDTFGFPLDLTELMARERGYDVDVEEFEAALERQRARSRADRAVAAPGAGSDVTEGWIEIGDDAEQEFVGYARREVETQLISIRPGEDEWGLQLRHNPFYAEGGGQISDAGVVEGPGWKLEVVRVDKVGGRIVVIGPLAGQPPETDGGSVSVKASVPDAIRHDTERNHTATHLLHAALRSVLGEHVTQRGSLVAPDRLRFDFAHSAPMTPEEVALVEEMVNEAVWRDHPVETAQMSHQEAVSAGAMALFGEKYGDVVRTVTIPGVSMELCGGTHLRHTGEVGVFKIVSEAGVAAGVRRIEAITGPGALEHYRRLESELDEVAALLKTPADNAARRTQQLLAEKDELDRLVDELRSSGGAGEDVVVSAEFPLDGSATSVLSYRGVRMRARDADDVRRYGDAFLQSTSGGVAVVAAELPGGKTTLFSFVSDDLIQRGIKADAVVRRVAEVVGGRGGGRPHMAQAGVEDPTRLDEALAAGEEMLRKLAEGVGTP